MKKRYLFPLIFLLLLGGLGFWAFNYFTSDSASKMRGLYLVPQDAIFIMETEEPIENWNEISSSEPWMFLQSNDYFAELTSGANYVDSLIKDNSTLFGELGSRQVIISAHMYKKDDYDFLYILDLENISKISGLASNFLKKIDGFKTTERPFNGFSIYEMYDKESKETLYLSFVENLLLCSYHHSLIEKAIQEKSNPVLGRDQHFIEVEKEVRGEDLFRTYVQYSYLDDYLASYLAEENEYVKSLSEDLSFTGLSFDYDKNETLLSFDGTTKLVPERVSYLSLLSKAGATKFTFDDVVSKRAASVVSLGTSDFNVFFDGFLELSKKESGDEYQKNITKVEKFLGIDLKENFISWIGDEISFVQTQPIGLGKDNEYAVFIKATDIDDAKENLDFIGEQIKKRTPVRFKGIKYNDHEIKFMSVKGMFKLMIGGVFGKIEKPYYTLLGDYVVFSNHPQTIKNIIDDYVNKQVLNSDESFKDFKKNLNQKSSVLIYVNTPIAYGNLTSLTDAETKSDVQNNKVYFDAFPHVAFQLTEEGQEFSTKVAIDYFKKEEVEEIKEDLKKDTQEKKSGLNKTTIEISDTSSGEVSLKAVENTSLIEIDHIILDDLDANSQEGKYDSGELKYKVGVKDGLKSGAYLEYSKKGALIVKGKYKSDKKIGVWRYYNESGKLVKKDRF